LSTNGGKDRIEGKVRPQKVERGGEGGRHLRYESKAVRCRTTVDTQELLGRRVGTVVQAQFMRDEQLVIMVPLPTMLSWL